MRGPRLKTPLLLLLLLLTSLSGTVLCDDDDGGNPEPGTGDEVPEAEPAEDVPVEDVAAEEVPAVSDSISATTPSLVETEPDPAEDDTGDQSSGVEPPSASLPETTEYPNVTDWTGAPLEEEGLSPVIILIPVVLVVVIIGMIVCGIFINRRWNKNARSQDLSKDPYLDGSSTEKVPMPMFEEDVPSVLELEMEELDQWMKKDSGDAEDSKQT